ncbi:MAG: TlpA disulfide reductase family protein [Gammaproteobacteria bacterium]|nr:TlpA disulfide reductase family protein [Gammaproteobacteria bacterium]
MVSAALAWAQDAPPAVGDLAPEFELPALAAGHMLSLAEHRGAVVYLEFWNSFCAPCRASFPKLDALRRRLPREDFEVIAVNMDRFADDARRFLEDTPVSFPVVSDASLLTGRRFGVNVLPTGFLLDRAGVIRDIHQGEFDMARFDARVAELIGHPQKHSRKGAPTASSSATNKRPF